MAVNYDLVIIGNGEKAARIAMRATQLKARVALVTNPDVLDLEQVQSCLGELLSDRKIWEQPQAAIAHLKRELHPYNQLELLQTSGVDVILGGGQFSDRHTFTTSTPPQRRLQARAFAITIDRSPPLRQIMGLSEADYLTCAQMLKMLQMGSLPKKLAVIGGSAIDCIVAQTLCRLGHNVTIFTDSPHILAPLDVEIARILQAQLEVEGIAIYTGSRITAVTKRDSFQDAYRQTNYQLWAGEHTSHYAQILLPSQHHNWANHLNLAQAGVKFSASTSQDVDNIRVNTKRQTTNHRIYICQQHRDIPTIIANTLFFPTARTTKAIVTQSISMQPPTASVGMTEIEARLQYGKDLFTLHTPPQKAAQTTDLEFCKLLCRHNGKIVGAHAVGNNALEIIETVAIAMNAKLNVYQIARLADASFGTITQLATQLDQQIYRRNLGKQVWLEKWFNWRRQWNI